MLKKTTGILILGAGIGGYETFRSLNKRLKRAGINKKITLIDKNNYFTFTPMLHEVASGSVQPNQCAIPVRQCIYKTPHEFWQATVEHIDAKNKCVKTSEGTIEYEYCIVALGSKTNYFGTPGAEKYSEHVRTLSGAIHMHQAFIKLLEDKAVKEINFTVVGGGATGVEVAGQFAHLVWHDVAKLYPEQKVKIRLIQSGDSLLKALKPKVQEMVKKELEKNGVEILFNSRVSEVKEKSIILKDEREVKSDLTAWTTGFASLGTCYLNDKFCEKGQIQVNQNLQSLACPHLYAIGDIASVDGGTYPKLGEIAHKQGEYVAKHICFAIKGKKIKPFHYELKGTLIPIGDWFAVAHLGPITFKGRFAWWIRRTAYLLFIPGFLRKLRIVLDWTLHSWGFRHIVDINLNVAKHEEN